MTIFFDRCMSIRLVQMLRISEQRHRDIAHHDDYFGQKTSDVQWISEICDWDPPPVVVSGDARILKRPDEVKAVAESNLTFLFMPDKWSQMSIDEMLWKFFKAWPDMRKCAAATEPTVFKLSRSMKVEVHGKTATLRSR